MPSRALALLLMRRLLRCMSLDVAPFPVRIAKRAASGYRVTLTIPNACRDGAKFNNP